MKFTDYKLVTCFIFIATACVFMFCATAQVRWLETAHNFGAFREDDGKVSCRFRFVNADTSAVSVRAARASCGCTAPSYTKTPVEPGDTGEVTVTFNPTGRPGRFRKTVSIDLAGETPVPRKTLTISGVVIGSANTLRSRYPVEAGAMKLRNTAVPFGSVMKGRAKSAFLEVYNASTAPIEPRWEQLPPYLKATPSEASGVIPPGEQCVYSLLFSTPAEAPYGIVADSAFIALDGQPAVKIDLTAIVEEDFSRLTPGQRAKAPQISVTTPRLDFGRVSRTPAVAPALNLEIANTGKSPLEIRRIYTLDKGVEIRLPKKMTVKPGKSVSALVTFLPGELPPEADLLNARIQVIANDPEMPVTVVRALAEITADSKFTPHP